MTGKSKKSTSHGGSTETTPDQSSKSETFEEDISPEIWIRVFEQAIKDAAIGTDAQRLEVIEWLESDDYVSLCEIVELDPNKIKRDMMSYIRMSKPHRVYFAKKLTLYVNGTPEEG